MNAVTNRTLSCAAVLRLAVCGLVAVPVMASAAPPPEVAEIDGAISAAVEAFYRSRDGRPIWFTQNSGNAATQLLTLLATADADGIDENKFEPGSLLVALRAALKGEDDEVQRAELAFSQAFVSYAWELQRDPKVGVIYVDADLKPSRSDAAKLLAAAAEAPSLDDYVRQLGWMNAIYGQLRQVVIRNTDMSAQQRHLLSVNLQRARALPPVSGRYVLVNTANQRLYMYDRGSVVDEMRVVVGKANAQTPLMNAYIRFALLNPYWNVPSDLTARLAPKVRRLGTAYLKQQRYQVVSDFGPKPRIIDPATINWDDVAAGELRIQMRQLPGVANSMGRIKFMFPNSQGVWLHDTPTMELFGRPIRLQSAGCIRLEDA